jgi:hypothetical protein
VLFSSYSLRYYITTKIWINGVSKWAFIILERIADFLSGNANCEFHPKKKHKPTPDYSLGSLLMSLSFYVLLINIWAGILIVSILLSLLAKCSSSLSPILLR